MSALLAPLLFSLGAAAPVTASVGAAPVAAGPLVVLALDLEGVNVEPDKARAVNRLVVAVLGELEGLAVTSQEDMRTLANLDAAKQAMDCSAASCLAEVAGALGARAVVFGSVTGLGGTTSISLSLFDSQNGRIERSAFEAASLEEIPARLRPALRALFVDAGLLAPAVEPAGPSALFLAGVGTSALGALALVGGGATTTVAELQLQEATLPGVKKEPLQQMGQVGLVVAAAGVVVGAAGVVLLLLPEGT